jgi:hypothetical protein
MLAPVKSTSTFWLSIFLNEFCQSDAVRLITLGIILISFLQNIHFLVPKTSASIAPKSRAKMNGLSLAYSAAESDDGFDGHNQIASRAPPPARKLPKSITRHPNGIPTIVSIM